MIVIMRKSQPNSDWGIFYNIIHLYFSNCSRLKTVKKPNIVMNLEGDVHARAEWLLRGKPQQTLNFHLWLMFSFHENKKSKVEWYNNG